MYLCAPALHVHELRKKISGKNTINILTRHFSMLEKSREILLFV